MNDLIVSKLGDARTLLSQAKDAISAKKVKDQAHAMVIYGKRQKLAKENVTFAHAVEIDAFKLMGDYLRDAPKAKGTQGQLKGKNSSGSTKVEPPEVDDTPTYAEAGIDKKEAVTAQFLSVLSDVAPEVYEEVREDRTTVSKAKREKNKREKVEPPPMVGKYRVIYADPPWSYGNTGLDDYGHAERHYPSMSIAELCSLPVKDLSEPDAVLFMWVTSPLLAECFPVITAWGFKYKTSFVWDKVKHNFGHYNSVRHELLLVCTRGSCTPDSDEKIDSVQTIERSDKHSEKPEAFRQIIDRLYPNGNRIELFSRTTVEGWERWGNE